MTRPSRNVDVLLLKAGRDLYPETGIAGLSVRKIAAHAGANLGMFHYHFRTKEHFVRQLLQTLYDEMFAGLELAASAGTPREALRAALNLLGRFGRDNGKLLRRLIADALAGEAVALEFLRANMPRHIRVIVGLIAAGQEAGQLRAMPLPQAIAFLAGSVAAPVLIGGAIAERALVPGMTPNLAAVIASDAAIAERVDCALAGLVPPVPPRATPRAKGRHR